MSEPEDVRHGEGLLQEYQALAHLDVVGGGEAPVEADQGLQELAPVVPLLDEGHDDPKGVGEHVTHLGVGLLPAHRLLEDVEPAGLDGDAEGLAVLAVLETPGEHGVHDGLQPGVDGGLPGGPPRRVGVDRLGDDRLHVLVPRVLGVEELAGAEGVGEGVLVGTQVVVHLAGHEGGLLPAVLGVQLVLVHHLYGEDGVGDLGPELAHHQVQFPQGELGQLHLQLQLRLGCGLGEVRGVLEERQYPARRGEHPEARGVLL